MPEKKTIAIWTTETAGNSKAALPTIARQVTSVVQVETSVIAGNLQTFLAQFQPVLETEDAKSPFAIDEIEISLAINAKGGIELLGKLEAGAEAGIKITLKRKTA